jgi:hypothetical protein
LDDVEERYPEDHYILIDDKLRILTAVKRAWGHRVTTVFLRQGHYALDEKALSKFPSADCTRIGKLATIDFQALAEGGSMRAGASDFRQSTQSMADLWSSLGRQEAYRN